MYIYQLKYVAISVEYYLKIKIFIQIGYKSHFELLPKTTTPYMSKIFYYLLYKTRGLFYPHYKEDTNRTVKFRITNKTLGDDVDQ